MKHVVIYSSGRSGSNRLLDVLDQHEQTNCRNEVEAFDTAIGRLPRPIHPQDLPKNFLGLWEAAVTQSRSTRSARDRLEVADKNYLRKMPAKLLFFLLKHARVKKLIGFSGDEWEIPIVALKEKCAKDIIPVLKLGPYDAWYINHHHQQRDQYIIHNIRNPEHVVQSWWNRYVSFSREGPEMVHEECKAELRKLGVQDVPDQHSIENLLRSELQLWKMRNDRIYLSLRESPRYMLTRYEDMSADPVETARSVFEFVGLKFQESHRIAIGRMKNMLFAKPHKTKLDSELVQAQMRATLSDSPLGRLYLS